jgi:hypothetical protein
MAALGFVLCFLVVTVYLLVALFPHQEELLPDDRDHTGDPKCAGSVGMVEANFLQVLILEV